MSSEKICPLMSRPTSGPDPVTGDSEFVIVHCHREKCQFWIQVYSTENMLQGGDCAIALSPQMADGLLRV